MLTTRTTQKTVFCNSISLFFLCLQKERISQATVIPVSKLTIPTITGTHTGMEGEHLGTGTVGSAPEPVVVVSGAAVVMATGGFGRLLILVKMKGLDYNEDKMNINAGSSNVEV